jgi:hypothetical protein
MQPVSKQQLGKHVPVETKTRQQEKNSVFDMPSIFMRDKPIFSSERMLHKDYYRRSSVEKRNSGRGSQGACRQDELIGGKPPVV